MTVENIKSEQCCGCGACMDKCPVKAIDLKADVEGNRKPSVDPIKCVNCGLCVKTCPQLSPLDSKIEINYSKKTLVGYYDNIRIANSSSSGGIFFAIAASFIKEFGGVVYGVRMSFENNELECKHTRICDVRDLHLIQGSKYVQSKTEGIYTSVKLDLDKGKMCLFSGTSCQIAALRRIVGNHPNLYTVDLVCHGVPKDNIFNDYIKYIEKKKKCRVVEVSFRKKGIKRFGKEDTYILTLKCRNEEGAESMITIPNWRSPFFRLFISRSGYRESCYNCVYATINKPSDITLGDFCPNNDEVANYNISCKYHYSTVIVHTLKGEQLITNISNSCKLISFPLDSIINHHHNLQHPSKVTIEGEKLLKSYESGGYELLQRIVDIDYAKTQVKYYLMGFASKIFCKK